jgi:hypothetical protein
MKTINPYMSAQSRIGESDENAARANKHLNRAFECLTDLKKYRLHYGETPVGMVVSARPMEVNSWNKNARAYFAHQITLGRDMLPILEWREVGQESESFVWRVSYRINGKNEELLVSALSKAAAKREAESMLSVVAVIKLVEKDEDIEGSIHAARAMNEVTESSDDLG